MKRLQIALWGVLGGALVAVLAPIAVLAVQVYVLPPTTHQADHLHNIPDLAEALRSCFSGSSAPTTPTPVTGQCWYNTTTGILKIWDGAIWEGVATDLNTLTLSSKTLSSANFSGTTSGTYTIGGTVTVASPILSGTTTGTYTLGGTPTIASPTITGNATTSTGLAFTASTACASGYTRVGLWCYDTDGVLVLIRNTSTDESSYTVTVVGSSYRAAIIRSYASIGQDATEESSALANCVVPGDSAVTSCSSYSETANYLYGPIADRNSADVTTVIVRLDTSGQIKTMCNQILGSGLSIACGWYLVAYLD